MAKTNKRVDTGMVGGPAAMGKPRGSGKKPEMGMVGGSAARGMPTAGKGADKGMKSSKRTP